MLFLYKAKTKEGDIVDGVIESLNRFSAARELRSRGTTPVSISIKKNTLDPMVPFKKMFSGVKVSEQISFCKNLSGMLHAGLSLYRALSVLKKQTKNSEFDKILTALIAEINGGGTLSSGLVKFPNIFSKIFVSMVRAGEESGNLAESLVQIQINLEKSNNLNKKVKGALIYPGVIFSAMIIIGVLMFAFVVPTLSKTFTDLNTELPASTKFIVFLGGFFSKHLFLSFAIIIGGAFGIFSLIRANFMAKYIDYLSIKMPIIGKFVIELNTARTVRSISSLLSSGVPIIRAIEITEDVVQNLYYKKVLRESREGIQRGEPFSTAFRENTKLFPIMVGEMIEVGEETGNLAPMLLDVSVFYEEEVENKTKNLSTIIEPFLMIIIGAAVGFFAISMISPLYSVMNNIK
jgi:type IV pilus assembly protein PilC